MPEAAIASITSPEQGAQHECSRTFFSSLGGSRMGLGFIGTLYSKIAADLTSRQRSWLLEVKSK
jgi:hypothetical protein